MKIKQTFSKPNKKSVIVVVVIAIAIVMLLVAYGITAWAYHLPPFISSENQTDTTNLQKSDVEKKTIEDLKDNPSDKIENKQTDTPKDPAINTQGLQNVSVLITNMSVQDDILMISGFVTNVSEDGGRCEFIMSKGDRTVIKTTTGLPNSTSTTCETLSIPTSELSQGLWSGFIRYSSNYSEGVSAPRTIAI